MKLIFKLLLLLQISMFLSACDFGLKQLGPTEYGVRFRMFPPALGGGIASQVEQPGETFVVWPWDRIYVLDTKIRNIEWGEKGSGSNKTRSDFVETRALDGNEVSLAVRIQYSLSRDPKKLINLVQKFGTTNDQLERLVVSSARADLRTYMNFLKTSEFFINEAKYRGESEVLQAMRSRLENSGIHIQSVNLKEHRFERILSDGSIDRSYQERINEVQTLEQETEKERLRRATVVADKTKEFNNVQADVNRKIEEAEGYKKQAQFRGDGYYKARSNEAKAIKAQGEAYVQGLQEKINALAGPGGKAILKLEISKSLQKSNPKFVVSGGVPSGSNTGNQLQVKKLDTNELLNQVGVFEALQDSKKTQQVDQKSEEKGAK